MKLFKPSSLPSSLLALPPSARLAPRTCIYDRRREQARRGRPVLTSRLFSLTTTLPARIEDQVRRGREDFDIARRAEASDLDIDADFKAAPEIDFEDADREAAIKARERGERFLAKLRVVPASPSYFTARPSFTDDYLRLQSLLRKHIGLPTVKPSEAPRRAWREFDTYMASTGEPLRTSRYKRMVQTLKRLNIIHPQLMPEEVTQTIYEWMRAIQPFNNRPPPIEIDEFGRAAAVGRRKESSAKAWLVEGEGDVLVNGKPLHQAFARVHDRESVVWALKATQRIDKYNVFAVVHGGGTTGQAEALTLAVSKALMAHEPALKPVLRKVGCVARDPRTVERKKPGHVKARKMPTWVKR